MTRIRGAIIDELRALDWVPRSVRSRARQIERAHAQARAPAAPRADGRGDGRRARHRPGRVQRRRCSGSRARRWSRSTSCGRCRTPPATRSRCWTRIQDPDAPDPEQVLDASELRERLGDAITALPERERTVVGALLLREPDPARDRRGPRGHRVARLAAAHEGRAAAEVAPAGRLRARLSGSPPRVGTVRPNDLRAREGRAARGEEQACRSLQTGSATWRWSATGGAGRRRCTRPCCSRPARRRGSARWLTVRRSQTPTTTRRRAGCRSPRRWPPSPGATSRST